MWKVKGWQHQSRVARGGGYAEVPAPIADMSPGPNVKEPISSRLSIALRFVACIRLRCHCRVSISGGSRVGLPRWRLPMNRLLGQLDNIRFAGE